jgi:hypothetical protein
MIRAAMFTPAFLKQCLAESAVTVTGLEILFASGDHLDAHDTITAQRLAKGSIINACGHTENSVYSTLYCMHAGEHCVNGVPVGQAITNSGVFVMDPQQCLVPLGVMGELVLTGDRVAQGYTDPALDCDRFVQVTINRESARAYWTRDRVHYRPADSQLEFFGHMDYQVKIHGHCIKLAEVEQALLWDDFVHDAVALVRELESQDAELVSFVTVHTACDTPQLTNGLTNEHFESTPEGLTDVQLKQALSAPNEQDHKTEARLQATLQVMLLSYMILARITVLDKMPLNANGKVDRRALGQFALDLTPGRGPQTIVPPENDVECVLCEEFAHILGLEVSITDNFFDLGGHLLMATRVVSQINQWLNTLITVREVFTCPVVADLAEKVHQSLGATTYMPIPRTQVDGPAEQSFTQHCLWFIDCLYPESTWYLMPLAARLWGPLDLDALSVALLALEERHEPLYTTFEYCDGIDL